MERKIELSESEIQTIVLGIIDSVNEEIEDETLSTYSAGSYRSYESYRVLINKFINITFCDSIKRDLEKFKNDLDEKVDTYFKKEEEKCVACNNTGRSYWSDGVYGACMDCDRGN